MIAVVGVDIRKQRLDSTSIRSAIQTLTRVGIRVELIRAFLPELRRYAPDLHRQVLSDVIRSSYLPVDFGGQPRRAGNFLPPRQAFTIARLGIMNAHRAQS